MKNTFALTEPLPLTTEEVAAYYRVKVETVRLWIKNGTLTPTKKVGRRFLFSPEAISITPKPAA